MKTQRKIFCCGCQVEVDAKLVTGAVTYPHRRDLAKLPFWKCDGCGNFVGCHHKTSDRTRPLGVIPTQALKAARQEIHRVIDPIWKSHRLGRTELYGRIARAIGVAEYHTAEIRSVEQAREVLRVARELEVSL
ncbi:DUF3268 family zinc-finger domain-containing protein [Rhizobium sp. VS19-DR104.2]|uniref:zinc-finger-containing protein n=1 Tax=unclassified Rhizobium TaxID=2613769 RepID=UPI001CC516C6|nr:MULTISPECIES: zinc-finger-containing protein [unclassified Rhizobium]MBZ5761539.1 DUF3268 family zinc-finger domain-containing protein [Rhizobium sp. VS19-DR96]MBZ5767487.1 DUF3268 family zinc-finger domain-containing protein [Rhizobium sp. VS19-DR129.2]MBZ5775064.1 DUF3268 family zinc-finger domain-containing protein [Rhizobium sp. VS19-DRK62.2]MBZ5785971.1 DUF3268 family zinc-finger domain-containing protein [Rhizobium sp. VS19-DR121]MBZ5803397.1 DUF3268 family zinc-finger domain-containi